MLYNLSLRNIAISISFLKLLIWLSAYLKIVLFIPVNDFIGFKGSFTLDSINLSNLKIKEYVSVNILIISYLDPLKLWF